MFRKNGQLVCQQLENISRAALAKYQDIVREFTRGRNGVYALYKKERLYYVGLATSLQGRLKQHLRDRHGESWDRFSVYLTIGNSHLKEMESLLLRISKPPGNRQSGKFRRCENLKRRFAAAIRTLHREELDDVIGKIRQSAVGKRKAPGRSNDQPVLSIYEKRPRILRATHKGKKYSARVRKNGAIRFGGKTFNSPSLAAVHAVGHPINGWWFWQFERAPGDWVRLRELRD